MINKELAFRKKWVEWAIAFAQIKIDTLSEAQRERLRVEAAFFTSPYLGTFDEGIFEERLKQGKAKAMVDRVNLENVQDALKPLVGRIALNIEIRKKQDSPPFFDLDLEAISCVLTLQKGPWGSDHFVIAHQPNEEQAKLIGFDNVCAVLNFSELINGLSVSSIVRCKGCSRYFLNVANRKKEFCTGSCYSRHFARVKMQDLKKNRKKYEAYLRKQAAYMKQRYRRASLGPKARGGRA